MNVLIAGSTGMIGSLILDYCLAAKDISKVTSLVRKPTGNTHAKLNEVVVSNFVDYTNHTELFVTIDAAFFCIGVYTGQVNKDLFKEITVDYAVAFAKAVKVQSPKAKFCLLSGQGADRTEKSRMAFAKFKGMAENQIAAMGLEFYTFRPGYIYPVEARKEPSTMYRIMRSMYPLIKLFGKNASVTSTQLAQAMFKVGLQGANQEIFENRDIMDEVIT